MKTTRTDTSAPAPAPAAGPRPAREPLAALAHRTAADAALLRRAMPTGRATAPDVALFNSSI